MVELIKQGVYLINGNEIRTDATGLPTPDEARENPITYGILRSHDVDGSKGKKMRIKQRALKAYHEQQAEIERLKKLLESK